MKKKLVKIIKYLNNEIELKLYQSASSIKGVCNAASRFHHQCNILLILGLILVGSFAFLGGSGYLQSLSSRASTLYLIAFLIVGLVLVGIGILKYFKYLNTQLYTMILITMINFLHNSGLLTNLSIVSHEYKCSTYLSFKASRKPYLTSLMIEGSPEQSTEYDSAFRKELNNVLSSLSVAASMLYTAALHQLKYIHEIEDVIPFIVDVLYSQYGSNIIIQSDDIDTISKSMKSLLTFV